jgi:hypothetical protein
MSDTAVTSPARKYDVRSALALAFCLGALYFDLLGWLLAVIGIVLLPGSAYRARTKWLLAALALGPKIAFLVLRRNYAPPGVAFTIEPWTLATAPSLWVWSVLLIAFGVFIVLRAPRTADDPALVARPDTRGPRLLKGLGFLLIAWGAVMLLSVFDGFQRIDDVGHGRWALRHAVRGTVATFTRDELALVEGTENHSTRGRSSYTVRVTLTGGRHFSVTTQSSGAFAAVRQFAATADLAPGKARTSEWRRPAWTNGASGFTLKDYVGTYDHEDNSRGERSTLEFVLENGRLAGKETVLDGGVRHVRALRNIAISDTGEMTFDVATQASAEAKGDTWSFSLQWDPNGDTGRLTRGGFEIGPRKYTKR